MYLEYTMISGCCVYCEDSMRLYAACPDRSNAPMQSLKTETSQGLQCAAKPDREQHGGSSGPQTQPCFQEKLIINILALHLYSDFPCDDSV